MLSRGRPPKPLELHKLEGTFRHDRHDAADSQFRPDGTPEDQFNLGTHAMWLWDHLVPQLTDKKVATRLDTVALTEMCRWYERYMNLCAAADALACGSEDHIDVTKCAKVAWDAFDKISQQFGMTPAARSKLRMEREPEKKGVLTRNRAADSKAAS